MEKRDLIRRVLEHQPPPYVPWSLGFTWEAREKLQAYYGTADIEPLLGNHLLELGNAGWLFTPLGNERYQDRYGVVWNRTLDKDIGVVENVLLPEPTLRDYTFPDPHDPRIYADIQARSAAAPDRFRLFSIGFSLYERAWTLRGMENLLVDFIEHPEFVTELFHAIVDQNIAVVKQGLEYDIDAVYFGDDWGQQQGLQMGGRLWRRFILPALERMYRVVRDAGKFIFIHSCGDVEELFPDLIKIGVNCFNPFQPEVMAVFPLMEQYRGKLTFHGGMSTQRTLPYGTLDEVRAETRRLLESGMQGNYIFAPAHAVQGDVPLENMLAFIEILQNQPGYR